MTVLIRPGLSRRALLAAGATGAVAIAGNPASARVVKGGIPWTPGAAETDTPTPAAPGSSYSFFSPTEAAFVEAATQRLIPSDENGAGAREAGCGIFIDRQLAGPYGRADGWYMHGPWAHGKSEQGYQSRMAPAEVYRAAIKAIDDYCRSKFQKSFAELAGEEQDHVIAGLENGSVELHGVHAPTFFKLLLQNTKEGFFADPIYGGNRDMVGWKLIGFPGARYDYLEFVEKHGERFPLPPVSIKGRKAWQGPS